MDDGQKNEGEGNQTAAHAYNEAGKVCEVGPHAKAG